MTLRSENPRAYVAWHNMKQRCLNSNNPHWGDYGGRGIGICDEWIASFKAFVEVLGEPPAGCWLERIDNDGDYEPSNCRWATPVEQRGNQRDIQRRPNHTGFNVVDRGYLLGYLPADEPAYRTVIQPYEIPGRPQYEWETARVIARVVQPPTLAIDEG